MRQLSRLIHNFTFLILLGVAAAMIVCGLLLAAISAGVGQVPRPPAKPSVASYPWHPSVVATVFSPNEDGSRDNAGISNCTSAWDDDWRKHAADENPYFVALPYADYLEDGSFNPDNQRIPWHEQNEKGKSELKNRWVEVKVLKKNGQTTTAYGQWEDVGPAGTDNNNEVSDPDYVFGPIGHDPSKPITVKPKNTFDAKAGIDLSERLAQGLGIDGQGKVSWRFVEDWEVPEGPWKERVTTSQPTWR